MAELQQDYLRDFFKRFDIDGSGTIDAQELETAMRGLGLNPSAAEVEHVLTVADADGSGEIDFEEFAAAVSGGSLGLGQADAFFSNVLATIEV